MSFGPPDIPQADPAIEQANNAERQRAEAERARQVQAQLGEETARRSGQFGGRSLFSAGEPGFRDTLGG